MALMVFSAELTSGSGWGSALALLPQAGGQGEPQLEVSGASSIRFSSGAGEAALRRTKGCGTESLLQGCCSPGASQDLFLSGLLPRVHLSYSLMTSWGKPP